MSSVTLNHDDIVCEIADYIIERPDQSFYLKMGYFHGQPMIVEQSDATAQLRRYVAVECDAALSDEEFCGYISEFMMAICQRQNDYRRNIIFGQDGSLTITHQASFLPTRGVPALPKLENL